jgi:hypothetical protein
VNYFLAATVSWLLELVIVQCVILKSRLSERTYKNDSLSLQCKYNIVVPPYPRVIRFKTYRGYVKLRIIPNAIYNVIFV